jgi:hypothetical protein
MRDNSLVFVDVISLNPIRLVWKPTIQRLVKCIPDFPPTVFILNVARFRHGPRLSFYVTLTVWSEQQAGTVVVPDLGDLLIQVHQTLEVGNVPWLT